MLKYIVNLQEPTMIWECLNLQACQNKKNCEIHLNHYVWKLISKHLREKAENMKLKSVSYHSYEFKPDEEKKQGRNVGSENASQQRSA